AVTGLLTALPGVLIWRRTAAPARVSTATIYAAAFAAWVTFCLVGSIPFLVTGVVHRFDNALFESVSGFTTTASSILPHLDSLGKGILLWRALMQWLGGI